LPLAAVSTNLFRFFELADEPLPADRYLLRLFRQLPLLAGWELPEALELADHGGEPYAGGDEDPEDIVMFKIAPASPYTATA